MIRQHYKIFLVGLIFLAISSLAYTEDGSPLSFSAKVLVSVSATENIKGQVESYIRRELRALHDVILVDEGAEWELNIIAMEVSTQGGYKTGVILSVVFLSAFNNQILTDLFKDEYIKSGEDLSKGLYYYPEHWLRTGPDNELQAMCVAIIADFDSQILEKSRKLYRRIMDIIKK